LYDEDDLLPLSALQHVVFCERRCALIHIECQWANNAATAIGVLAHSKVDDTARRAESRGSVRIARGLPLRSLQLGLSGKTDAVEFRRRRAPDSSGLDEEWDAYPIEYKSGRLRHERCYEVQACAQAMCLEEMLGRAVPRGALFYGKSQKRVEVAFDHQLREETERAAVRLHQLVRDRVTPPAEPGPKCAYCSMLPACLPRAGERGRVAAYVRRATREAVAGAGRGSEGP
jgi:CRISPR-associated exonuclease Cas4